MWQVGGVTKDAQDKFVLSWSLIVVLPPIVGVIAIINKTDLHASVHSDVLIAS